MENLEIAVQAENDKLKKKLDLIRLLVKRGGFYQYYFKICNEHKTREDAFEYLNNLYFELVGEFRYSSYDSFRKANR